MRNLRTMIVMFLAGVVLAGVGCAYPPCVVKVGDYGYQQAMAGRYGEYVAKNPDGMRGRMMGEADSFRACHLVTFDRVARIYEFSDEGNAKKVAEELYLGIPFCREMFKSGQTQQFLDRIDGSCTSSVRDDVLMVQCQEQPTLLEAMFEMESENVKQ